MNYWLNLFTPYTWIRFRDHGADISGFRPRQRNAAFLRVKRGDLLICYLVKISRWCGIVEVASEAFEDAEPIFTETNDPFPVRFRAISRVALDLEHSIPIEEPELWKRLSFTRDLEPGAVGWAQAARLRQSLIQIPPEDGALLVHALEQQEKEKRRHHLDAADLRQIKDKTVVRTEEGEIEVEVPEREEINIVVVTEVAEVRASTKVQAQVAQLGLSLGFSIWAPPNDRAKVLGRGLISAQPDAD